MCRWDVEQPGLTWQRMNENKNKELDRLNGVYKKLLDGANVTYFEGFGKVLDPHTVEVDGKQFTVSIFSVELCFRQLLFLSQQCKIQEPLLLTTAQTSLHYSRLPFS